MTEAETDAFVCSAMAMIASLIEDNAPVAVRRLPSDPLDANKVLAQLRQVGGEIAALAQSAISARSVHNAHRDA